MYRVNSISKQIVKLQIPKDGKLHDVALLPGNFVIADTITSQMKNLEGSKVIRVREITVPTKKPVVKKPVITAPVATPVSQPQEEKEDSKNSKGKNSKSDNKN